MMANSTFEWRDGTSTIKSYHYAGSTRLAIRMGTTATSTVNYLLDDHLHSTAMATFMDGGKQSEKRYKAWGEERYSWAWSGGATPIIYRFTGQREDASIELYFYNARYHDPMLGRFIQPDSIVPQPCDPQSLNRYAYAGNNPLRYVDPSGHCPTCFIGSAVGAVTGVGLYYWNTQRSGQDFQLREALVAAGTGAVAGALIGTGVGAAAGASMLTAVATSTGVGIAAGGGGYMAANIATGEKFDTTEFTIASAVGGAQGAIGQVGMLGTAGAAGLGGAANLAQYELTKMARGDAPTLDGEAGAAIAGGVLAGGFAGGFIKPETKLAGGLIQNVRFLQVEPLFMKETMQQAIKRQLPINFARSFLASYMANLNSISEYLGEVADEAIAY